VFQVAIGRFGSRISLPSESLSLSVYIDAGGRASMNRVWGGLAAVGEQENAWLVEALGDLRAKNPEACLTSGELKGAHLPDVAVRSIGRRIRDEDHRVLFWSNWYPESTRQEVVALAGRFVDSIHGLRAERHRLDHQRVDEHYHRVADYLSRLKGINRYKVMSMVAHIQWLTAELKRVSLADQLCTVKVVVDRENLPTPSACAELLKLHVAASLQAAGMSVRLTGRALRERHDEGAVVIDVNADSRDIPGLQLVDMLLQAVQKGEK
jgi:hypothetical protein